MLDIIFGAVVRWERWVRGAECGDGEFDMSVRFGTKGALALVRVA